jgi:hypothetical protein
MTDLTFREAFKQIGASWAHELRTKSAAHICKQAAKTLYLFPALLLAMLYMRVRRVFIKFIAQPLVYWYCFTIRDPLYRLWRILNQ